MKKKKKEQAWDEDGGGTRYELLNIFFYTIITQLGFLIKCYGVGIMS